MYYALSTVLGAENIKTRKAWLLPLVSTCVGNRDLVFPVLVIPQQEKKG